MGPYTYTLKASEDQGADQGFTKDLDNIKNPFENGIPKPAPVYVPPPAPVLPAPVLVKPVVRPIAPPVKLPVLHLQGVIVGDGVQEAIINDKVVSISESISGARVIWVGKGEAGLLYKGKKFFLKVD